MAALQLLDPERSHLNAAFIEDAGLIEEPDKPWSGAGRRVQGGLKCLPLLSVQLKTLAIRQGLGGAGQSTLQNKIAHRAARCQSGALQCLLGQRAET